MNRRAVLDQIITSVIVLVAVVFLMTLFVNVSSNISFFKGGNAGVTPVEKAKDVSARVMLDLFLTDNIDVSDRQMLVNNGLKDFDSMNSDDKADFVKGVEELFDQQYGCKKGNSLIVAKIVSVTASGSKSDILLERLTTYIDYPLEGASAVGTSRNVAEGSDIGVLYPAYSSSGKEFATASVGNLLVAVRGKIPC